MGQLPYMPTWVWSPATNDSLSTARNNFWVQSQENPPENPRAWASTPDTLPPPNQTNKQKSPTAETLSPYLKFYSFTKHQFWGRSSNTVGKALTFLAGGKCRLSPLHLYGALSTARRGSLSTDQGVSPEHNQTCPSPAPTKGQFQLHIAN